MAEKKKAREKMGGNNVREVKKSQPTYAIKLFAFTLSDVGVKSFEQRITESILWKTGHREATRMEADLTGSCCRKVQRGAVRWL